MIIDAINDRHQSIADDAKAIGDLLSKAGDEGLVMTTKMQLAFHVNVVGDLLMAARLRSEAALSATAEPTDGSTTSTPT